MSVEAKRGHNCGWGMRRAVFANPGLPGRSIGCARGSNELQRRGCGVLGSFGFVLSVIIGLRCKGSGSHGSGMKRKEKERKRKETPASLAQT